VDTFDGSFEAAGVVVAAACDEAGIVNHAFARRPVTLRIGFLTSGEIARLRFLRPNETPHSPGPD
jgi:hypothetical protein